MLNWEIQKAVFNTDYTINVKFADGTTGTVKINQSRFVKVFTPLKNLQLFSHGFIKFGAITWNVGDYELDLAPDTMYNEIKKNNGLYVLC